jgi:hypothetical protein
VIHVARTDSTEDLLVLLDRLEELREDMEELGVTSLVEVEQRIAEIESQISDEPDSDIDGSV